MGGGANVVDQLDDGAFADLAGLDPVGELSGEHGVLRRNGVGEEQPVPLFRLSCCGDELDIKDLNQRLRVHVAGDYRRDRIRSQIHRHGVIGRGGNPNLTARIAGEAARSKT